MNARARLAWGVAVVVGLGVRALAAQAVDRRQSERLEEALRLEGQAVVALADLASGDPPLPADFVLSWHNDFFKAQTGTFVPFVVSIGTRNGRPSDVLLYVRAARRRLPAAEDERRGGNRRAAPGDGVTLHPFEEIYPVVLPSATQPVRIARGFSLPPGPYDITVVVREREREQERGRRRMAAALRRPLDVPDFGTGELTTSTVVLADSMIDLPAIPGPAELVERPYVIGGREIQPAADAIFARSEELIVVLLVYNPSINQAKHFDLEVEYHFFRKSRVGSQPEDPPAGVPPGVAELPGERYFNRTESQRFNPQTLGAQFDPGSGQPVMAGQGVPLGGFPEGDYRLSIKVTDLVSGRAISRDVTFTVRS